MKKILVLPLLFLSAITFAQLTFQLKGITKKNIESIPSGTSGVITFLGKNDYGLLYANFKINDESYLIDLNKLDKVSLYISNLKEFWQVQALQSGTYENILKSGMQYKLRNELDEEIIEYVNSLRRNFSSSF